MMPVSQGLLPFKIELVARPNPVTAYAGVPVLVEARFAAVPTGLFRELRDALGTGLALGDLDDDGRLDALVGAGGNEDGGPSAGAVFIFPGGSL